MAQKPNMPQPVPNDTAEPDQPWALRIGYALLLFWLIRSWLVPLQQLSDFTEVYRITPFLVAFALFLALDTLRMPGAAAWIVRIAIIVATTAVLHSGQWFPGADWWLSWLHDLNEDAVHAAQGELEFISPATRTMLFVAGWGFFIWVLQSFVADRQQLLWFVMMTLIYLIALQLIFDKDMSYGLLSAAGAGLLLQGWLQADRWTRWKRSGSSVLADYKPRSTPPKQERSAFWTPIVASCVLTALLMLGAWAGALQHPVQGKTIDWSGPLASWQERLHFLEDHGTNNSSASAGKTGYGSDDSRLGYPLTADDSVVFVARTTKLTYWRGDSKSTYTGSGWYASDTDTVQLKASSSPSDSGSDASGMTTAAHATVKSSSTAVTQQVFLKQRFTQLFLGGSLMSIDSLVSQDGDSISPDWLWKDQWSERYFLPALADPLSSYTVQVASWEQGAESAQPAPAGAAVSEANDAYLQLPDRLPARVSELAFNLTKDEPTVYAKVEAIERYLRSHYTYSLEQTRPPAEGQDFVDQFLFEQKMGYCDHFSTAMAVMLRSVGIPSRWVKGFAPGQVISMETNGANGTPVYNVEVRNKNAHSWVEVYLPTAGWVPFDPTPGFGEGSASESAVRTASTAAANQTSDIAADGSILQSLVNYTSSLSQLIPMVMGILAVLSTLAHKGMDFFHNGWLWIRHWLPLSLWIAVACLTAMFIHMWITFRAGAVHRTAERDNIPVRLRRGIRFNGVRAYAVQRASDRLWRKLQRRWGRVEPAQTLREYMLTRSYNTDAQRESLLRFIRLQETLKYNAGNPAVTRRQLHEAWQDIRKSL
ncbi:transglutaminase family protein [Paenibacillus sp. RC67]|uniref:transglutaminase family protein n=1 Tax=Paenibacillus sp. RC67 TaxID=3039392 RepID=UPI0024AE7EDE|nr:transglutaminase family protein [Paenibacillus sp. RC67]